MKRTTQIVVLLINCLDVEKKKERPIRCRNGDIKQIIRYESGAQLRGHAEDVTLGITRSYSLHYLYDHINSHVFNTF